jgi:hypothetical protein
METPAEEAEAQVRRFMTTLFVTRAKRHLKTLSVAYGWSPETLAEYEARFIKTTSCVPSYASPV